MKFLAELEKIITERKNAAESDSYTKKLLNSGIDRILRKVGEESGELIIASKNNDVSEIKNETADLIYHIMVMLAHHNISLESIESVLKERHKK